MSIDEAIRLQEHIIKTLFYTLNEYEKEAIKLGIEALKVFQQYRKSWQSQQLPVLPGETDK